MLKRELHDAWQLAREKIQQRKEISKRHYDKYTNDIQIKVGDKIRVKNHKKHGKYDVLFRGPYTIQRVDVSPTNKTVIYKDGNRRKTANKDHVKLDRTPTTNPAVDEEMLISLINMM